MLATKHELYPDGDHSPLHSNALVIRSKYGDNVYAGRADNSPGDTIMLSASDSYTAAVVFLSYADARLLLEQLSIAVV